MIKGLTYIPEFLSKEQQETLVAAIDNLPWLTDLRRRVQHYGYKYDYRNRKIDDSMRVGDIPPFMDKVVDSLLEQKIFIKPPDQLIINEYLPGQGISFHVDCVPCFHDIIVTISLGSEYILDLVSIKDQIKREISLEVGSLLKLSGEARYKWRHGIAFRKDDYGRPRERRMSLTFRNVII